MSDRLAIMNREVRRRYRQVEGPAAPDHMILATILGGYPDVVEQLGGDPDRLLRSVGLDSPAFRAPGIRISFQQFQRLMGRTVAVLNCPEFGLKLAEPEVGPEIVPELDQLIRKAPSLEDVFSVCSTRLDALSRLRDQLRHRSSPS